MTYFTEFKRNSFKFEENSDLFTFTIYKPLGIRSKSRFICHDLHSVDVLWTKVRHCRSSKSLTSTMWKRLAVGKYTLCVQDLIISDIILELHIVSQERNILLPRNGRNQSGYISELSLIKQLLAISKNELPIVVLVFLRYSLVCTRFYASCCRNAHN